MSIRVRCPGCNTEYVLADSQAGKKVRCKKCEAVITVEAAPKADAPAPKRPSAAVRAETPRREKEPALPAQRPDRPRRARDEDDDVGAPPIKKKGGMALWWILGGMGVGLLFVLACSGVGAYLVFSLRSAVSSPVAVVPATPIPVDQDKTALPAENGQPAAPPAVQPPPDDKQAAPAGAAPFHLGDVRKGVVFIRRHTAGKPTSTGTGFFVSADGLIATNRHVVQSEAGPDPTTVLFVGVPSAADPDKLDYFKGQVAYVAPAQDTLDFAIVKVAARPGYPPFHPLTLAATKPELGSPVAAIGFPFAQIDNPVLSFNKGNISAARVDIEGSPYYQTDAAVNPGNSGGPLVNPDGQVVGVVSRKMDDANNMGFALYLSETGLPAVLNQDQVVRATPEQGPLDVKQLPTSGSALTPTHMAAWDVTRGEATEERGVVIAENRGSSYWLTNKTPLPENFQVKIECFVVPILPRNNVARPGFGPRIVLPQPPVNMNMVRSLYVRFGTDVVADDVMTMGGTTVHLSAAQTQVAENGVVVTAQPKGVPADPFVLTLTRRGDELTVAVNDEVRLTQKLKSALQGSHKFSVGGFQSALLLHAAVVAPVEGPPVPPPVAVAPPKPPPSGPPVVLPFDSGWDKPVDPDGDCKIVPEKDALTIEAPAKRHDLAGEGAMNAPRLVRDVTGDFTAQVQVGGDLKPAGPATAPGGLPFEGAGLVLMSDDRTFARLERAAVDRNGTTDPYVNWEVRADGRQQWSSTAKLQPEDQTTYLRLRRVGGTVFAAFSRDGKEWTDLPAQALALPATVKVGAAALTTSATPFAPKFADFRLGAGVVPLASQDPKFGTAKPPAGWKGPEWTTDLDKMKAPDAPASGWLFGADFKIDEATMAPNTGQLILRQGKPFETGAYISLGLGFRKGLADFEGKTITVAGRQVGAGIIFAQVGRTPEGEKIPKVQPFTEYTMKLVFGKGEGLKLPGTIYICLPDEGKSVVAGKFLVESR